MQLSWLRPGTKKTVLSTEFCNVPAHLGEGGTGTDFKYLPRSNRLIVQKSPLGHTGLWEQEECWKTQSIKQWGELNKGSWDQGHQQRRRHTETKDCQSKVSKGSNIDIFVMSVQFIWNATCADWTFHATLKRVIHPTLEGPGVGEHWAPPVNCWVPRSPCWKLTMLSTLQDWTFWQSPSIFTVPPPNSFSPWLAVPK